MTLSTLILLLILSALVSFLLAAFNAQTRINLTALGLALATAAWLVSEMRVIG